MQQELKTEAGAIAVFLRGVVAILSSGSLLSFGDLLPEAFTSSLHHHVVNAGTPNGVSDYAAGRYALLLYLA